MCLIEWEGGRGRVLEPESDRLTDDKLLELIRREPVTKIGIDAPLGWPLAFIDAISTYRDRGEWLAMDVGAA